MRKHALALMCIFTSLALKTFAADMPTPVTVERGYTVWSSWIKTPRPRMEWPKYKESVARLNYFENTERSFRRIQIGSTLLLPPVATVEKQEEERLERIRKELRGEQNELVRENAQLARIVRKLVSENNKLFRRKRVLRAHAQEFKHSLKIAKRQAFWRIVELRRQLRDANILTLLFSLVAVAGWISFLVLFYKRNAAVKVENDGDTIKTEMEKGEKFALHVDERGKVEINRLDRRQQTV